MGGLGGRQVRYRLSILFRLNDANVTYHTSGD